MERHGYSIDTVRPGAPAPALKPRNGGAATAARADGNAGDLRQLLVTCVLALYPLVGSVTIMLAALLLAGERYI